MDCSFYINFCSIFSKGTQPFDFIICNVIQKSAYKVKYISQINGGLIMFFASSRLRFFKISWHNYEQYGKDQHKKKEHNQHSSVFKVLTITPMIFIFLSCCEKAHDNNEFSHDNSKPCPES